MSKKGYVLLLSIASVALMGVLAAPSVSQRLEAADGMSYQKTISLTAKDLTGSSNQKIHDPYVVSIGGLPITIGTNVYPSNNSICINSNAAGATIAFPVVQNVSGPHGTGYQSVQLSRPSNGSYCNDIKINSYNAANEFVTTSFTLSSTSSISVEIPGDFSSSIAIASLYTGSLSTAFTSILVTYGCFVS